jgi:mRNA interferase MazF
MVKKWSIYWADLNPVIGSEQAGKRPVLVVSNNIVNKILPVVTILPISSVKETVKVYPTEIFLPMEISGLPKNSVAMVHQVRTVSKQRLGSECSSISNEKTMHKINSVIREYFELG